MEDVLDVYSTLVKTGRDEERHADCRFAAPLREKDFKGIVFRGRCSHAWRSSLVKGSRQAALLPHLCTGAGRDRAVASLRSQTFFGALGPLRCLVEGRRCAPGSPL